MIPLYEHQRKIIDANPKYVGLFLGTGGAKTRTALELAKGRTLVVCPKQQNLDKTWQNNAEKFEIKIDLTVMSKEAFRGSWDDIGRFDTLIVDECHTMVGFYPDLVYRKKIPYPKTSQMFDSLRSYVEKYKPDRFYMCSATPVSKPMNLFAIGKLFGKKWSFLKFRARFYFEKRQGYISRWFQRKDEKTEDLLAKLTKSLGYTGKLQDWFDVPEQTHRTIYVGLTVQQRQAINRVGDEEADPMVARARFRTIENGILYEVGVDSIGVAGNEFRIKRKTEFFGSEKLEKIVALAEEFPKLLIFAPFTGQIEYLQRELEHSGYEVRTLTGKTKNRQDVVREAEASERCIVIAQSTISAGYELPSFPCVVFCGLHWQYLHYEQGLGRVLRANHLKKNLYVHLVVKGGVDEDCYKAIMSGQDFQEKVMEQE